VAGLTAAHLLSRVCRITVFEREDYPGGHTCSVEISSGPDAGLVVDTGFIVMNHRNYPLFTRLLEQLGVALQDSDMSFSYHCEATGFHYAGNGLNGLFSQRRNLANPAFARMLADIVRFGRCARRDLAAGGPAAATLGEYVRGLALSPWFAERYLYPMTSAIWSTAPGEVGGFPARSILRFFDQHGLLTHVSAPRWRTVVNGARSYVAAIRARLNGEVVLATPALRLTRREDGVEVATARGIERFDGAVVATHADQALALLADPSPDERRLLGAWRYTANRTVLHTDTRALPPRRRAWSSWNYTRERAGDGAALSVTYYMNRLQRLRTPRTYCVSLNRRGAIDPAAVVAERTFTHPRYDAAAAATQVELPRLNGLRRTWFCGSYFGHGFHEDAVRSAAAVARDFGVAL
jgi:predicted NAD/FAD-binding protein